MPLSEFEIENSMSCQHYINIHGKYVQVKTILIEKTLYVIERGRTIAHYYTHLCQQQTILHIQFHSGLQTWKLGQK